MSSGSAYSFAPYMPPLLIHTTLEPGVPASCALASGCRSSSVIRCGPSTCTASTVSWPWAVSSRCSVIVPALCTSPCSAGTRSANSSAQPRTASRSPTSQTSSTTSVFGLRSRRSFASAATLSGLRPSRCTVAPRSAKERPIADPMPEVAPVTSTRLPSSEPGAGSAGHHLLRSAEPTLL